MKKILLVTAMLVSGLATQAQGIDFGIKAGANFANFNGDVDTDGITSFHAGAVVELNVVPMFSVQAEGIFSTVGGKYKDALDASRDINLDYISVPVLAKFYILPNTLSLTAGPQFSFLVNDGSDIFETKKFELAASGGLELKIIAGLFAQARYNIGITKVNDDAVVGDVKNGVFQLSVGYFF
ncbi:MAG: porin family protein [Bacteroidota bacterium]